MYLPSPPAPSPHSHHLKVCQRHFPPVMGATLGCRWLQNNSDCISISLLQVSSLKSQATLANHLPLPQVRVRQQKHEAAGRHCSLAHVIKYHLFLYGRHTWLVYDIIWKQFIGWVRAKIWFAGLKISLVRSSETSKNDSWTSGIAAGLVRQTTAYFWFSHN